MGQIRVCIFLSQVVNVFILQQLFSTACFAHTRLLVSLILIKAGFRNMVTSLERMFNYPFQKEVRYLPEWRKGSVFSPRQTDTSRENQDKKREEVSVVIRGGG